MSKNWIIFDRDGTLIVDKGYLHDPGGVEMLPGAEAGLALLARAGFMLTVVSNQSGVGRGFFPEADVLSVHEKIKELLAPRSVTLAGMYYCPHAPGEDCACRKPKTGLIERACADLGQKKENIVCVAGDKECDMLLAHRVHAPAVLISSTGGDARARAEADFCFDNLLGFAEWLLSDEGAALL